jgi:hypothetical protein
MDPAVVVAIVVALVAAVVVAVRLQRVAKRNLPDSAATPLDVASGEAIHIGDPRFRLLSFQGGSVPADLGPVLEELRRNGIEVDEETLRRKLADGAAIDGMSPAAARGTPEGPAAVPKATAPVPPEAPDAPDAPATATVVDAVDVPVGNPVPGRMPVRVTLELQPPGGDPVREHVVAVVDEPTRKLLVQGAVVPIRYDPADPSVITLVWALA